MTKQVTKLNTNVLITGATSGIGWATATLLARNGYPLVITGRRRERLETLKTELEAISGQTICALNFDIRDQKAVENAVDSIPDTFMPIDILINNAGLAVGLNPLHEGVTDDWERMVDTNIKGLLYITRKITPSMVERGKGHVINISSIAGRESYPMGNVYCATKHGVEAITKSMRLELVRYGIKVSTISPGAVNTEFSNVRFKGDKQRADKVYEGFTPLSANDIAEAILFMISRPPHVNIDDMLIMPTDQAFARDFNRR